MNLFASVEDWSIGVERPNISRKTFENDPFLAQIAGACLVEIMQALGIASTSPEMMEPKSNRDAEVKP